MLTPASAAASARGPSRARPAVATGLAAIVTATAAAAAAAVVPHRVDPGVNEGFIVVSLLLGMALGLVGALLVGVRPANRLGPLLYVVGAAVVFEFALREYAYRGLRVDPGSLPLADVAGWAGLALDPLFFPGPLAVVLVLFPDGRPMSCRWGAAALGGLAAGGAGVALCLLRPGPLADESFGYEIPWRGALPAGAGDPVRAALGALTQVCLLLLTAAVVGLLVRHARAGRDDRARLRPLAIAATLAAVCLVAQLVPGMRVVGTFGLVAAVAVGFPLALAVGVLRYRLWDLDRVLVAAIVYGALTVVITTLYVGVVVGFAAAAGSGTDDLPLPSLVVATVLVAVVFAPAKDWVGRAAQRLVYGVRATPYEALAALPRQLAEAPAVDDVLPRTARALTLGLGVPSARARAFVTDHADQADQAGTGGTDWADAKDDGGREAAATRTAWFPERPGGGAPPGPGAPDGSDSADGPEPDLVVIPVRHLGTVVGDVAVQSWPDRPLGRANRRLLADLAAQAGPALRAVALTAELRARLDQITAQSAELRASRARLAAAQADERRRLERDIHDGAQQQLVAMTVTIRQAEEQLAALAGTTGDASADEAGGGGTATELARAALRRCQDDVDRCIDDLRELARGIYPPVLAARGLPTALRARARRAPLDVRVESAPELDGRRFATPVEIAAYFACLEALQNAAKHARGASVFVRLALDGDSLCFTVTDDGPGFDPADARSRAGTGLLGMADRVGAAGGTLTVETAPGRGTTVRGRLPAQPAEAVQPAEAAA
ncbi:MULTISPECIES: sensor histidine kinase [Pseudofrankia]|uniref:sensor histidine kinase n=1 Tax=Pseudofrankia TaxID=2994363 RepID=UPI001041E528|nr:MULTISPECIES: ATP-binding protein [Pseudofrankia]